MSTLTEPNQESPKNLESGFSTRRNKLRTMIRGDAALFVASAELTASRDVHHPHRQDSDFFYFTGLLETPAALLVLGTSRGPRSVLFLKDRDPLYEKWIGERLGIARAKRNFSFDEVREWDELEETLLKYLADVTQLYYAPGSHPDIDSFIWEAMKSPVGPQRNFPVRLSDVRLLTSKMRIIKDRRELRWMKHAADITAHSMIDFIRNIKIVKSERHGARILESNFTKLGSLSPAFPTIIASGKNATCLHHEPKLQPLWRRELVLIDAGATFRGYASDITRTVPWSGRFTTAQAEVYDVVHEALETAITKAKPGATLDTLHHAAVRSLTKGLVELGVLKGEVSALVHKEAYKPYFMHRTGHWLGLDVHDIAPRLSPRQIPFESGMCFTVEPGLYFDANDKTVPAEYRGIGIRLEDDVVITEKGNSVITRGIPVSRTEIEQIMS